MSTISDLWTIARLRTRTSTIRSNLISDASLLILSNQILEECRKKMVGVESNLVYSHATLTTVAETTEYAFATAFSVVPLLHDGLLVDGVWLDGEDVFFPDTVEENQIYFGTESSTPSAYYLTADDMLGLLPTPDDVYTLHLQYWLPLTSLASSASTVPWLGVWDQYITKRLEYEINLMYERDISAIAAELVGIEEYCMSAVFRRGIRTHSRRSDFFNVEGV